MRKYWKKLFAAALILSASAYPIALVEAQTSTAYFVVSDYLLDKCLEGEPSCPPTFEVICITEDRAVANDIAAAYRLQYPNTHVIPKIAAVKQMEHGLLFNSSKGDCSTLIPK